MLQNWAELLKRSWCVFPPIWMRIIRDTSGCIRIAGLVQVLSHSLKLVLFSGHSVLEEYKQNKTHRKSGAKWWRQPSPQCAVWELDLSLFLLLTMGNIRRVERLITVLVLPVNLALSPATPSSLVWSWLKFTSAYQHYTSISLWRPDIHWRHSDWLAVKLEEQVVSSLKLFI